METDQHDDDQMPGSLTRTRRARAGTVTSAEVSAGERTTDGAPTGGIYVCRLALVQLRLSDGQERVFTSPEARALSEPIEARLREELRKDARVLEVIPTQSNIDIDNARTHTFYDIREDVDDIIEALGSFEALRFNTYLAFRVRMPAKNQPRYRSLDDVPTDDYLVIWDGVSLAVQWEQDSPRATGSGGHVVLELVQEIGKRAGYEVEILACSPACYHRFIHADIVTFDSTELPDHFHAGGGSPVGSTIVSPYQRNRDDLENLRQTYAALHTPLTLYAEAQTLANAISFLERRSRADSEEILAIVYSQVSRRRLPTPGAFADLWAMRGSRSRTRRLTAGLWLALAMVDSYRGVWFVRFSRFREVMEASNMKELTEFMDPGQREIERLNLDLVRASLQEVASRAEGRALVMATAMGAGAAMAGAATAALLT